MKEGSKPTMVSTDGESSATGLIISTGWIIEINKWGILKFPTQDYAIGSGTDYARGAMMAGASAEEAVRIASNLCIYTGGKITVLRLHK